VSRAKGTLAETKATLFLQERGYTIVERNFYSRFGEIDIITQKEGVLHFVEVKSGVDFEKAILNITPKKLSRIIRTAQVYMKKTGFDGEFEIDAIVVTPVTIEMLENITI
jgi:putative endonuclease